jgi:hypothetical protein
MNLHYIESSVRTSQGTYLSSLKMDKLLDTANVTKCSILEETEGVHNHTVCGKCRVSNVKRGDTSSNQ